MRFINKKTKNRIAQEKIYKEEVSPIGQNVPNRNVPNGTLIVVILLIGILIRIVGIANMPNAFNCDEASAGYEAFSILNYGIDRNRK